MEIMETELINSALKGISTSTLPCLLMALAIWWLQKSNNTWISALNLERDGRLKDHEERIEELQRRCTECEVDRADLRQKLFSHLGVKFSKAQEPHSHA